MRSADCQDGVESRRAASLGAVAPAVTYLVGRFGDDCADPALAQVGADGAGRVGLVPSDPVGAGPRASPARSGHAQMAHQDREHGRVASLAREDEDDQGQPVHELVDLRAQTSARPADPVVAGLSKRIPVIRQVPVCRGSCSWRAGGHG